MAEEQGFDPKTDLAENQSPPKESSKMTRRSFLKNFGIAVASASTGAFVSSCGSGSSGSEVLRTSNRLSSTINTELENDRPIISKTYSTAEIAKMIEAKNGSLDSMARLPLRGRSDAQINELTRMYISFTFSKTGEEIKKTCELDLSKNFGISHCLAEIGDSITCYVSKDHPVTVKFYSDKK